MATSLKLSELQELSSLTSDDLFLVTDLGSSSSRKVTYATLISDVLSTISTGDSALQDIIDALQAEVDSNKSTANLALQGEVGDREAAVAALQLLIDTLSTEGSARNNRITALETTVDNLEIDIAPDTLNSISELADALGDDPQIITNLQAELTEYKAHIEERNLELALAYDVPTYAEIIYGG